jgi:hypothetical protein
LRVEGIRVASEVRRCGTICGGAGGSQFGVRPKTARTHVLGAIIRCRVEKTNSVPAESHQEIMGRPSRIFGISLLFFWKASSARRLYFFFLAKSIFRRAVFLFKKFGASDHKGATSLLAIAAAFWVLPRSSPRPGPTRQCVYPRVGTQTYCYDGGIVREPTLPT